MMSHAVKNADASAKPRRKRRRTVVAILVVLLIAFLGGKVVLQYLVAQRLVVEVRQRFQLDLTIQKFSIRSPKRLVFIKFRLADPSGREILSCDEAAVALGLRFGPPVVRSVKLDSLAVDLDALRASGALAQRPPVVPSPSVVCLLQTVARAETGSAQTSASGWAQLPRVEMTSLRLSSQPAMRDVPPKEASQVTFVGDVTVEEARVLASLLPAEVRPFLPEADAPGGRSSPSEGEQTPRALTGPGAARLGKILHGLRNLELSATAQGVLQLDDESTPVSASLVLSRETFMLNSLSCDSPALSVDAKASVDLSSYPLGICADGNTRLSRNCPFLAMLPAKVGGFLQAFDPLEVRFDVEGRTGVQSRADVLDFLSTLRGQVSATASFAGGAAPFAVALRSKKSFLRRLSGLLPSSASVQLHRTDGDWQGKGSVDYRIVRIMLTLEGCFPGEFEAICEFLPFGLPGGSIPIPGLERLPKERIVGVMRDDLSVEITSSETLSP